MIPAEVLIWSLIGVIVLLTSLMAGLCLWAAMFTQPGPDVPFITLAVYRFGQGLVVYCLAMILLSCIMAPVVLIIKLFKQ